MAMRQQAFVKLIFEGEEGEIILPMNWINKVGTKRFVFKPSAIEEYSAPIANVKDVEQAAGWEG